MEGPLGTKDIEGPDVSEHFVKSSGSTGGHELLGPDPQSITVPNEVISLLHRADALLAEKLDGALGVDVLESELTDVIKWCERPAAEMARRVLDKPKELLPHHLCPQLFAFLMQLQTNGYKARTLASLRRSEDPQAKKKLATLQYNLDFRVITVISLLARMRNQFAIPPIIMMRSIDRQYYNTTRTDWEMMAKERFVLFPKTVTTALRANKDWLPNPFPEQDLPVSVEYAMCIHDNKEWRFPYKWERILKDGTKIENPLYHTVTSK